MKKKSSPFAPLYPTWVRADPGFALDLLAQIKFRLKTGAQLEDQDIAYLCDAIGGILGDGLSEGQRKQLSMREYDTSGAARRAAKALCLVRPRGNRGSPLSDRNMQVYKFFMDSRSRGRSALNARIDAGKEFGIGESAVEKICRAVKRKLAGGK